MNNTYYEHYEENKIKELLMYRKVVRVENNTLFLDNNVELEIVGNDGCCCGAGCYDVTEINDCDNAITNVEFVCDSLDEYDEDHSYKIFVYAEDKKIKLVQVDGSDGNGYYGTGYTINVKLNN